jgi:hypothetical protein
MTAVVSRSADPNVLPTILKAEISAAINIAPPRNTAARVEKRSREVTLSILQGYR